MNWIKKTLRFGEKIKRSITKRITKKEMADSKWMPSCCTSSPILKDSIFNDVQVNTCPNCDKHYPLTPRARFNHFYGKNNWIEIDTAQIPQDPLSWPDGIYKKKLAAAKKLTGQKCSVVVAQGIKNGIGITSFAINSSFIGGAISVDSAEAILKACDLAIKDNNPLVAWSEGGGQIMFESGLSLQGMARTVLGINTLKENNLPFINIYTNKCYGGISASFAALGDVAFAEKSSMIGFAGQAIVKNQTREELPPGFQSAEELLRTGFVDGVFHRKEINEKIMTFLSILLNKNSAIKTVENETTENNTALTKAS